MDELRAPAALEPPCSTVRNVDVETVGGVLCSNSLYGCRLENNSSLKESIMC